MEGIDLSVSISYQGASFRYFNKHEYHVTRHCNCDVLLLVFEGVLKFSEDGEPVEVHPGEYYIQKAGGFQEGIVPSEEPKYLYIHFQGDWTKTGNYLPRRGTFDYELLKPLMEKMHRTASCKEPYVIQASCFYSILSSLYRHLADPSTAEKVYQHLVLHYNKHISLSSLCKQVGCSKNHVINLFKQKYGITPFACLTAIRLENAKELLLSSTQTLDEISNVCGFSDYSHFYKTFKKETTLSPYEWRKRKQNNTH